MKKLFCILTVVLFFFAACNSGGESTTTTTESTEQAAPPAQEQQAAEPVQAENPAHGEPGHVHTEGAPADASAGTVTPQGDVKLNPPHGEPGHRCDIAVGSPLPN